MHQQERLNQKQKQKKKAKSKLKTENNKQSKTKERKNEKTKTNKKQQQKTPQSTTELKKLRHIVPVKALIALAHNKTRTKSRPMFRRTKRISCTQYEVTSLSNIQKKNVNNGAREQSCTRKSKKEKTNWIRRSAYGIYIVPTKKSLQVDRLVKKVWIILGKKRADPPPKR